MEGDRRCVVVGEPIRHFNPLPPHGGRRHASPWTATQCHFNPLPPHGGRRHSGILTHSEGGISIHSLRMEGDPERSRAAERLGHFNPLPPHGGRLGLPEQVPASTSFQSTPSAWRETCCRCAPPGLSHFNPLPPHGGRLLCTHSLGYAALFQSTPSAWRETAKLHRKAFFISPILVQSCKKGCKRLHSAPEKMVFFEKREKNLVRNLQHLSVRL